MNADTPLWVLWAQVRFYIFDEGSLGQAPHADVGPGAKTIKYGGVTGKQLCFVSFHTSFHGARIVFLKGEIDGAYDKPALDFLEAFTVTVDTLRSGAFSQAAPMEPLARAESGGNTFAVTFSRSLAKLPNTANSAGEPGPDATRGAQSVPYGIIAGPRLLRLFLAVESIMMETCPKVLTFSRGQLIYNPEEYEEERSIYLIVSGNAEYAPLYDEEQHRLSRINRGDSIAGLQIGAGEFYGELKFLLGNTGDPSSFCIRACTDTVQVLPPSPGTVVQRIAAHSSNQFPHLAVELAFLPVGRGVSLIIRILNCGTRVQPHRPCLTPAPGSQVFQATFADTNLFFPAVVNVKTARC